MNKRIPGGMVDAPDSKSEGFGRPGSTPGGSTKLFAAGDAVTSYAKPLDIQPILLVVSFVVVSVNSAFAVDLDWWSSADFTGPGYKSTGFDCDLDSRTGANANLFTLRRLTLGFEVPIARGGFIGTNLFAICGHVGFGIDAPLLATFGLGFIHAVFCPALGDPAAFVGAPFLAMGTGVFAVAGISAGFALSVESVSRVGPPSEECCTSFLRLAAFAARFHGTLGVGHLHVSSTGIEGAGRALATTGALPAKFTTS